MTVNRSARGTLLLALALALAASAHPLRAQTPGSVRGDTVPEYILEGVVVTTSRAPSERLDLPQKVEVVTSADLASTAADNVADALKKVAGVDVIQFPGLLSGVSVRGFRPLYTGASSRTLILIDGRPAGTLNLATIDLAHVDRIEILKGPASALYGSSAMGGAINVITRRTSDLLHGSASIGYGSFGTHRAELTAGGRLLAGLAFDASIVVQGQAEGYRVGSNRLLGGDSILKVTASGESALPLTPGDTLLDYTRYGYGSGALRVAYDLSDRWTLEGRGELFRADEVQNPGDLNVTAYSTRTLKDQERRTADLRLDGALSGHDVLLRAYSAHEDALFYDTGAADRFVSFRSPTRTRGVQLQDVLRLGDQRLTAGVDHQRTTLESAVFRSAGVPAAPYSPDSEIRSSAAFAEALFTLRPGLTSTLGARWDRIGFEVREVELFDQSRVHASSASHSVFNPSAGLQLTTSGGARLHASAGRAFVAPESFQIAGYSETTTGAGAVHITRGNPELRPESSVSWDAGVGLHRPSAGFDGDLTYFHADVSDRITRLAPVAGSGQVTAGGDSVRLVTTFGNADAAEIRGVEASASYDLGALDGFRRSIRLFASGTRILRSEQITGGTRSRIQNVADLTIVSGLHYDDLRRFSGRVSSRYVGPRWDSDFVDWMNPGDLRYPAFLVLDLTGNLRVGERFTVGAELSNLTDENYFEVRGYNLPGRALRLRAAVAF